MMVLRLNASVRLGLAAVALAVILSVIGCDSKGSGPDKELGKLYEAPKAKPSNLERSTLRLLHNGWTLYVGDDQSQVFKVYAPPAGATDVTELPDGWDKDHYRVKGWEKGKDGFGVILIDDNVAMAMFTSEGKSQPDFDALLADYVDVLGRPDTTVEHGDMSYRFWNNSGQRLMLAVLHTPGVGSHVTQALGADEIMDALRMNPDSAKTDIARAQSMAAKQNP